MEKSNKCKECMWYRCPWYSDGIEDCEHFIPIECTEFDEVDNTRKYRVVVELEEDVFDELCSYPEDRVDILFVEEADVEESGIKYEEQENLNE